MVELGAEGLVTELVDYMKVSLAPVLLDVDSRYPESIGLQDIAEWRTDDPTYSRMPDRLPAGWIAAPMQRVDQWGTNYDYLNTDVLIWVLIRDSNTEVLRKRIYRTIQAVWETLKQGHFDQSVAWQIIEAPEMDFSEIVTGANGLLYSDARLRLTMFTRETA